MVLLVMAVLRYGKILAEYKNISLTLESLTHFIVIYSNHALNHPVCTDCHSTENVQDWPKQVGKNCNSVLNRICWGRDSSVSIATRYWLDGPGIESRWRVRFSASVQTGPGAHPASYTIGMGVFPGGKAAGAWR